MTQDLKRVVVLAGSGVPEHMIGKLREQGMTVVTNPDFAEVSPDALRVAVDPSWTDEAASVTPEMIRELSDRSPIHGGRYGLIQTERHDGPAPWSYEGSVREMGKRKARRLRGTR